MLFPQYHFFSSNRFFCIGLLLSCCGLLSPNAQANKVQAGDGVSADPDWQTVQYRSQLWVWGWTLADVSSIVNNARLSESAGGEGRRARAKAEGIRAALGLWSVWKHKPAYFSLDGAPTEAQTQAQIEKASAVYRWQSRVPNLVVNLALAGWVMDQGDDENAGIVLASGIFWGEVSLWTQRMLDTDWHWRVQDDQLHLAWQF